MPNAPDKAIYDDIVLALQTTTGDALTSSPAFFKTVLHKVVNFEKIGQNFPACIVLLKGTEIVPDKGVGGTKRGVEFSILYYVRADESAGDNVNLLLSEAREVVIGRNNGGNFDGGLMKSPTRNGAAGYTWIGDELRGKDVFAETLGLPLPIQHPFGAGLIKVLCSYCVDDKAL